jgi:hypothetical protein
MMKNITLLLALFVLLLSACAGSAEPTLLPNPDSDIASPVAPSTTLLEDEAPALDAPDPTTVHQEGIVTDESALPGGAETLVDLAKADLAQRLAVEITAITLISYDDVVWPDSSLGCPQPGMAYLQVPKDGSRIVLEFEGTTYDYHTGGGRNPFLCEQTIIQKEDSPQLDLGDFITPSPSTDQ